MIRLKKILISSFVALGLAYLFVNFGLRTLGFFTEKEETFFKQYLMNDEKLKEKYGRINNIQKEIAESEKEEIGGIQRGIYRFKVSTNNKNYLAEFEWSKYSEDSIVIDKVKIIDSRTLGKP